MAKRFGLPTLIAIFLAFTGGSYNAQQPLPSGFVDPKPLLDAAMQAIGNDKLNCVTISGTAYDGAVGQQHQAGTNVDWPRIDQLANYTRTMNWQARTMKEEFDRKPGLAPAAWKFGVGWVDGTLQQNQHQIFALNGNYAWHMDGPGAAPVASTPDLAEIYQVELWLNPHGFLKAAMLPGANPKATWRWELGEMGRDGPTTIPEKMYVVSITAPNGKYRIDATINKERMLQRIHTWVPDPVLGDMNYEHEFTNDSYIDAGNGIKFPTVWHSHQGWDDNFNSQSITAGHNAFGGSLKDVKPNVCPDAVSVPDAVRTAAFPTRVETTKLADGVFLLGGSTHNSVAVEFPTYTAVFEGPLNEERSLAVIDEVTRLAPNKPIRFLINSHQHFDHAGGLRTYRHIGATIVTSWHNWEFYNRDVINYAPRTLKPDMVSLWPPTELAEGYNYETVRENYVLEDAGRIMRVYYVNPLQHAEGMLMAYLPKEKMLIEADLVDTDKPLPMVPSRDQTSFYNEVTALKLDVAQIVPVHGKPIAWSEFAKLFQQPRQTANAGQAPASAPNGTVTALTNARVIDGTGRAPIDRATLLISNGRITAVGPATAVAVPAGATRVDVGGKTIIPGLVNAHGHLNVAPGSALAVRDDLIRRLHMYARYGVTTVVSLDNTERDELEALKLGAEQDPSAVDRARLYVSGMSVAAKTPEDARSRVNRLADLKAHVIKFHLNGNPNDMSVETWRAIIDQAHTRGLKTATHMFYLKDARNVVDQGGDILAHSVRDQNVTPDFIAAMKQKNATYVPTLTRDLSVFVYESTPAFFKDPFFLRGISLYRDVVDRLNDPTAQAKVRNNPQSQAIKVALEQANKNLKTLSDAGVTIALGTDSGALGDSGRWQGYFEHVEMEMMVKAGMTPMQTIVASTRNAARAMGLMQLGTLEPGNWADLVVLSANPLENILNTRRIDAVWVAGKRLADVEPVTQTR